MGVLGLWQLLAPVGQPVTLESLENKIFAVDISIWLNQAVKGYRDSQGGSVPNAHLFSLFSRLCKLLFYKIRPIIVFDGGYPELKKQTIINRQQRRAAVKQISRDFGLKILTNYLAAQQLGQTVDTSNRSKVSFKTKEKARDEIFKLPPLPESSQSMLSDSSDESKDDVERKFTSFSREDIKYLNKIDIESEDFNALPPDVKQEILSTLKESRRHRTWDQYEELPKESNDFSSYQMQCLLKRRKLQSKLEEVQKDIRQINSSAYVSQYTNDHVIGETNKIMSDDTSHYVLLKKIVEKKVYNSEEISEEVKSSNSVMSETKNAFIRDLENVDFDEDFLYSDSDAIKKENDAYLLSQEIKNENNYFDEVDDPPLTIMSHDKLQEKYEQNISNKTICKQYEKNLEMSSISHASSVKINDQSTFSDDEILIEKEIEAKISSKIKIENPSSEGENDSSDSSSSMTIAENKFAKSIVQGAEFIDPDKNKKDDCMSSSEKSLKIDKQGPDHPMQTETGQNLKPLGACEIKKGTGLKLHSSKNDVQEIDQRDEESGTKTNLEEISSSEEAVHGESNSTLKSGSSSPFKVPDSKVSNLSSESSTLAQNIEQNKSAGRNETFSPEGTSSCVTPDCETDSRLVIDDALRQANTELQENLDAAAAILEAEQAKQDRQSRTVQDHMVEECKELLRLFGIPFVVSPLEAEAQCAFFDIVDYTQGTITDDSDVWLFGGRRVYKNFFTQNKYVESYKDKEIFHHFGLSRKKLINFALLTGSDYTEGIEGVGPVTAMEIISEFPGEGMEALQKFKEWWEDSNKNARPPENKVRAKLLKLVLAKSFPEEKVVDAYLNPEVDSSMEKFSWGRPDLDAIRDYARERFGWNQSKVDNQLLPVLKKLNERDKQMHIDSFFTVSLRKQTNLFPSKRIMSALKKITSPQKQVETKKIAEPEAVKRKSRTAGTKTIPTKRTKKVSSIRGRGRGGKRISKSQGPALSESSSESDS